MMYEVNLAKAHWGAQKLNEILPPLQARFEASLNQGVLLELENGDQGYLEGLLEEALADTNPR